MVIRKKGENKTFQNHQHFPTNQKIYNILKNRYFRNFQQKKQHVYETLFLCLPALLRVSFPGDHMYTGLF